MCNLKQSRARAIPTSDGREFQSEGAAKLKAMSLKLLALERNGAVGVRQALVFPKFLENGWKN